jgi:hypothetical protein
MFRAAGFPLLEAKMTKGESALGIVNALETDCPEST